MFYQKRINITLLLITLILFISACGGQDEAQAPPDGAETGAEQVAEAPAETSALPTETAVPPTVTPVPPPAEPSSVWEEFSSDLFGFSILMPGRPDKATRPAGEQGDTTIYTATTVDRAYAVSHTPLPPEALLADETQIQDILDITVDGQLAALGATLIDETDAPLNGFPGREVELESASFRFIYWHVIAGDNLYQAAVVIDRSDQFSEEDRAFLDSLTLTEPDLLVSDVLVEPAAETVAEVSASSDPYGLGDAIDLGGDLTITVNEVAPLENNNAFLQPQAGYQFLAIDITVTNDGTGPGYFVPFTQMALVDSAGQSYEYAMRATVLIEEELAFAGDVPAGEQNSGLVSFEVPIDAAGLTLILDTTPLADGGEVPVSLE